MKVIIDRTYLGRKARIYKSYSPTLRAGGGRFEVYEEYIEKCPSREKEKGLINNPLTNKEQ